MFAKKYTAAMRFISGLVIASFVLCFPMAASADEPNQGLSLSASPAEITVKAGETFTVDYTVNDAKGSQSTITMFFEYVRDGAVFSSYLNILPAIANGTVSEKYTGTASGAGTICALRISARYADGSSVVFAPDIKITILNSNGEFKPEPTPELPALTPEKPDAQTGPRQVEDKDIWYQVFDEVYTGKPIPAYPVVPTYLGDDVTKMIGKITVYYSGTKYSEYVRSTTPP
jgi:hypothetical protein